MFYHLNVIKESYWAVPWVQISFQTKGKALHPQHYKSKGWLTHFHVHNPKHD